MTVFADSFYWIALTNSTDAAHELVRGIIDDIVTTDEVSSECLTFLAPRRNSCAGRWLTDCLFMRTLCREGLTADQSAYFNSGLATVAGSADQFWRITIV